MSIPAQRLSDIGERAFIRERLAFFSKNLPSTVEQGIGDDCAIFYRDAKTYALVTTDLTVENTHFLRNVSQPEEVGARAFEVNVSDIASMGGTPEFAWMSLGLPKDTTIAWIDAFLEGVHRTLDRAGVSLLGGDTIETEKEILVDVMMMGYVAKECCKKRSGAREGDAVCVTGFLGNAGCALKILLEDPSIDEKQREYLIRHHVHPRAQKEEGAWLGRKEAVGAMMDISDGIGSDLSQIAEMSQVGAKIDLDALPLSTSLKEVCQKMGWDPYPFAIGSGDDFCLLVTVKEESYASINKEFFRIFGRPLWKIGEIVPIQHGVTYHHQGREMALSIDGYNHFC